jgi:hypothetical protein
MEPKTRYRTLAAVPLVALAALLLAGCPVPVTPDTGYDAGFAAGFAVDDEYWLGYDDSSATVDGGTIYYQGDLIDYIGDDTYDSGYFDGLWYAYNDGYFVSYDDAFTEGFRDGYRRAFASDWFEFLSTDEHVEWRDGGYTDGYNDGFSEGRILGAVDYDLGLDSDWLDAINYYREPNDVYIEELDLGTGAYGPVELYEYGTVPPDLGVTDVPKRAARDLPTPGIRSSAPAKAGDLGTSHRVLTPRDGHASGRTNEAVNAYRASLANADKAGFHNRAARQ